MERTYTLQDVLAALRRRRNLALVVACAVLLVGLLATFALPSEYAASTAVQIEPRHLPPDYFPAQSGTSFEDRMRTVKHGVLARPVLERVVRETDFFPDLRDDVDEAVERMRRSVEVRLEGEVPSGPPALLFVVEVRGRDPKKVAKAAELLPRYYAEMTRRVLGAQARALRETLDGQTNALAKQLAGQEARILEFKVRHQVELPEMVETNARSLAYVQSLIELRLGAIADARRRRAELLSAIPEGPSMPGMAETAYDAALRRVQSLEATYGTDHPDVKRARREMEEASARRDDELGRFREERIGVHLARIDAGIFDDRAAVKDLEKERLAYLKRVEAAPARGQELAALSRDYEVLRGRYAANVSRRSDAAAAEALLAADDPRLFRVVENAVTPRAPVAPDRARLVWLAVLAAVALGLGAAGIAEWLDASMRGPEDAASLGVPVLAAIPRIGPGRTRTR
jgi:uncharacterized protein involved in exopolysaccharide biosynthesis